MVQPRKVTIKATKNGSKIDFEMEENGHYTELLLFNKDLDKIKKNESYQITFTLDNDNGANLEFVQDRGDVMYVLKGSNSSVPKCPKNANGNSQTPFTVSNVTATTLTVDNPDDDVCFYKFALRFIDKNNGNAIVTFDPIYGNQNGGLTLQQNSFSTGVAFVGGAALGSLITMMSYNVGLFG